MKLSAGNTRNFLNMTEIVVAQQYRGGLGMSSSLWKHKFCFKEVLFMGTVDRIKPVNMKSFLPGLMLFWWIQFDARLQLMLFLK